MSKFLMLIHQKNKKQNLNAKPNAWYKFCFNARSMSIGVIVVICVVGILYLVQINNIAIQGFKIKELETKRDILKESIRKTELRVAEMQSMQKVQERIGQLGMVGVGKIQYASVGGSVAVK